ncbi:MS Related Protein [Caenorhabditis elegans]|uniref:MS Related Protein n=1 Tax=Caenorhabditis elegans TaxID=6239 RepID=O44898_CAEEL|nr:MS Related Protein [Caenorhabditis elegans]CCD65802.1 MS Related Protein [Caenorhabditis elegans]|eukprot:NP_491755.1 MS Related Protein [Caenorhabditis elegans]
MNRQTTALLLIVSILAVFVHHGFAAAEEEKNTASVVSPAPDSEAAQPAGNGTETPKDEVKDEAPKEGSETEASPEAKTKGSMVFHALGAISTVVLAGIM